MSTEYLEWRDATFTWGDATKTWQDLRTIWEDGPLSVKRGAYARYIIMWAGGWTSGTGPLVRTVTHPDGSVTESVVSGAEHVSLTGGGIWIDVATPMGEHLTITYTLGGRTVTVRGARLANGCGEVLSSPHTGESVIVSGIEIRGRTYYSETTATWRNITINGDPVVHSRPEQSPVHGLTFITETRAQLEAVNRIAARRQPMLLRSPVDGIDSFWFVLTGERSVEHFDHLAWRSPERIHRWDVHIIAEPQGLQVSQGAAQLQQLADAPELKSLHPQWMGSAARTVVSDTARYEAFPRVTRHGSGLVATWCSQTDHYHRGGPSFGRIATSSDGKTWSTPTRLTSGTHTPVAVRSLGSRLAVLAMTRGPYTGYIMTGTSITSLSTPRTITAAEWGTTSWTFPGDLLWVDDGTTNGLMLAACYSGDGIHVTASTDVGATWTARAHPIKVPWAAGGGAAEPQMVRLPDGRILMLVRWDRRDAAGRLTGDIHAMWSSDLGKTWTAPAIVIPDMTGQPCVDLMPDGALIATLRDPAPDDSPQSWALAESRTNGETWIVRDHSDEYMMYGNAVAMPDGTGLLVGASHLGTNNADVWAQPLQLGSVERATLADIHARWDTLGDIATDALVPEIGFLP